MGIIRKRPDPALTTPYNGLDSLDLYRLNAPAGDRSDQHWPSRFVDWNGPLSGLPERVLRGVRAASPNRFQHESPLSLLARMAVDRALAVTREEFFEPTPDREGAIALVRQACESALRLDARFVHTLGSMLVVPAPGIRQVPGSFRIQECFVNNNNGTFRDCCRPKDLESAIEQIAQVTDRAGDVPVASLAAWTYAQFNIIHPFANGNGRVSRVLASMVLLRRGWPPIRYVPFDNALLYTIFQQIFAKGPEVRGAAFARAFDEIHARSVAGLGKCAEAEANAKK